MLSCCRYWKETNQCLKQGPLEPSSPGKQALTSRGVRGGEAAATAAASIPPREACKLLHGPTTSQEQSEPRRQPGSQEQLQLPLLGKEEEEEEERGGTDSATSPRLALEPDSPAKRAPGVPVVVGSASEADR